MNASRSDGKASRNASSAKPVNSSSMPCIKSICRWASSRHKSEQAGEEITQAVGISEQPQDERGPDQRWPRPASTSTPRPRPGPPASGSFIADASVRRRIPHDRVRSHRRIARTFEIGRRFFSISFGPDRQCSPFLPAARARAERLGQQRGDVAASSAAKGRVVSKEVEQAGPKRRSRPGIRHPRRIERQA